MKLKRRRDIMGIFDKALKTARNVGNSIGGVTSNVGSSLGTIVQDNSELAGLKMQMNVVEQELQSGYAQVGKNMLNMLLIQEKCQELMFLTY